MFVSHDVLVLSIPAELTAEASDELRQELLSKTAQGNLQGVVVSCDALEVVDTTQARRIFSIAELARLHQLDTIFCAIGPGVAAALVELDFDAGAIQTSTSVEYALRSLECRDTARVTRVQ